MWMVLAQNDSGAVATLKGFVRCLSTVPSGALTTAKVRTSHKKRKHRQPQSSPPAGLLETG